LHRFLELQGWSNHREWKFRVCGFGINGERELVRKDIASNNPISSACEKDFNW
jgi:hypothetical protein